MQQRESRAPDYTSIAQRWMCLPMTMLTAGDGRAFISIMMFSSNMSLHELNSFAALRSGLIGPIIVTSKGKANADGSTNGIDQDFLSLFQEVLEEKSPFASANEQAIKTYGNEKRMKRHLCACPTMQAMCTATMKPLKPTKVTTCAGMLLPWAPKRVCTTSIGAWRKLLWHADFSLHCTIGNHAAGHGNTLMADGRRVDQVSLVGGNTATLDLRTDNTGTWMFHCHVSSGTFSMFGVLVPANGACGRFPLIMLHQLAESMGEVSLAVAHRVWQYTAFNS
eukprot:scaffold1411_cov17-Tisochrysis_lutea.AAC.1